jgi:dipeptidyl aminopeptidase/acylaminoacyl peptidase
MTTPRLYERDLPVLLTDTAAERSPDYLDDVFFGRIANVRQRPTWTFPERWLPMDIATSRVPTPRIPWRQLGVLALIGLLIAVAAAAYVGSQRRLPAPFGLAGNGLLAYAERGDIFTVDPSTGTVAAITTGPDGDSDASFSPDGRKIALLRADADEADARHIVVTDADGSNPLVVTKTPIPGPTALEWGVDSRTLLTGAQDSTIRIFDATHLADPVVVATGAEPYPRPYRPPDGSAILIKRGTADMETIVRLDLDTMQETVLATGSGTGRARWSPDGSKVVYNATPADDPDSQRLFVVNADGTGTQQITAAPGVWFDIDATWSPDGNRIAFVRYERVDSEWLVRPIGVYSIVDGSILDLGPLPRDARAEDPVASDGAASPGEGFDFEWSPDGQSIIAIPGEAVAHPVVINAQDGTWRNLAPVIQPGSTKQVWQRLAP